ncbi:MAG: hypothetical protein ACI8RN_001922 [Glaciecola sp.]|jgi:hypothetical protein|uniref:hypothetical protein n=1 Tax=Congregibacter sp. TaxID=2744308 RepID=UPI0039E681AA
MPRGFWLVAGSVLAMGLLSQMGSAQTDPYTYYGGEIEAEAKNAAIEACEYRVLIEEQRCNRRANKTSCIKEVHSECREEFADEASKEPKKEED